MSGVCMLRHRICATTAADSGTKTSEVFIWTRTAARPVSWHRLHGSTTSERR